MLSGEIAHNLPLSATTFVGRERELESLSRALTSARLLTLTGTGGAGKTRLSLEVARRVLSQFSDGAYFVDLAPLSDPALVAPAVAAALGIREQADTALLSTLTLHLADRRTLLIFDNCEHVSRACATLADALLRASPGLTIIATSRLPLNTADETLWRTPALSFPDPYHPPPHTELEQYEAVQLFVQRVRLKKPRFSISMRNAAHVTSICYHLDGLPLAIELAAARATRLPVEEVSERLYEHLRAASADTRGALPRHATLNATVAWSYDLLSGEARTLLRRLSVFAGGFTLDAAEGVCMEGLSPGSALDLMTDLADISLIVAEQRDGETRYRMLDTIRHFAEARAAEDEDMGALRNRHLAWYSALAESARPEWQGPNQTEWFARLEREHDNLRAALQTARGVEDPYAGPRLARSLSWFWYIRGHLTEGRRWLDEALAHTEGVPPLLEAEILYGAALLARAQGDLRHAASLFTRCLALYRELDDPKYVSASLNHLGIVYINLGDYTEATGVLQEAISIREAMGDRRGVAISLNNLANIATDRGDYTLARGYYAECVEIHRAAQNAFGLAVALNNLGHTLRCLGEYDEAERLVNESLQIKRDLGDGVEIASSLHKLAEIAWCRCRYEDARRLCDEGLAALEGTGDREATGLLYNALGEIARIEGDLPEARAWYERTLETSGEKWVTSDALAHLGHVAQLEKSYRRADEYLRRALQAYGEIESKRGIGECLLVIARIAADSGLTGKGAEMLKLGSALLERTGYRRHPDDEAESERTAASLRTDLGKGAWASMGEREALSPQEAVNWGLAGLDAVKSQPPKPKRRTRSAHTPYSLTNREMDVLRLVAEGLSDADVAERLALSANTVHSHLHSIYNKLNVTSRAAAGHFAQENGLFEG